MPIVVHSQILRIHGAAVTVGLGDSRRGLLAGIQSTITAAFPTASNPSAQLLSDLDCLNDLGRLPDGSVPLRTWLANALALSGPRAEADVFQQVLDLAKSPLSAPAAPFTSSRSVTLFTDTLQSTFISHGAPDQAFAERLDAALRRRGVKTFLFTRDAIPGQKLHRAARQGLNTHERVILVCSARSLGLPGVRNEIEETLTREARDGGASYLIPITLDDFVFSGWTPPDPGTAQAVRNRVVADFRGAHDPAKFEADVARLVAALASEPQAVVSPFPHTAAPRQTPATYERSRRTATPQAPSKARRQSPTRVGFAFGAIAIVGVATVAILAQVSSRPSTGSGKNTPSPSPSSQVPTRPAPASPGPTAPQLSDLQWRPGLDRNDPCWTDEEPLISIDNCSQTRSVEWLRGQIRALRAKGVSCLADLPASIDLRTRENQQGLKNWYLEIYDPNDPDGRVRPRNIMIGGPGREGVVLVTDQKRSRAPLAYSRDGFWCQKLNAQSSYERIP